VYDVYQFEHVSAWAECLAVGRSTFVENVKGSLGLKTRYREVTENEDVHVLMEQAAAHRRHFGHEKLVLGEESTVMLE